MSILIYQAYREEQYRKRLFLIASGIHFAAYIPSGCYQLGTTSHIIATICMIIITIPAVLFAISTYKNLGEKEKKEEEREERKKRSSQRKNWQFAKQKLSNIEENK